MSYRLFTDVCSDLPLNYIKSNNITVLPMPINLEGRDSLVFADPSNPMSIGNKLFYDKLRLGVPASTSQINTQSFIDAFEPVLSAGIDLLYISLSSGLSSTYNNACMAAEELKDRYPQRKALIVDSLSASLGQGLLVHKCIQKRTSGMPLSELAEYATSTRLSIQHWFTVDDLSHLRRGGRISGASAMIGTVLALKPILLVDNEGHLVTAGKVQGRTRSLRLLADKFAELSVPNSPIFLSHGDDEDDALALAGIIKERFGVDVMLVNSISPVIGSHSGPGTIALFFIGKSAAR